MTLGLFLATGFVALGDWAAVAQRRAHLEYLLKPLALLLLILAAASADLGRGQTWIVLGLAFGLLGDVGLMLSGRTRSGVDLPFLLGLASFLLGHVCYIAGLLRHGVHPLFLLAGLLVVGGAAGLALPRVLGAIRRSGDRVLFAAVGAYSAVLGAMAVVAVGTGALLTALGGLLFLGSDAMLASARFARPIPHGPLLVIVSYHLGQLLIVLGLLL